MSDSCYRCGVSVDTTTDAEWEYVYRFVSEHGSLSGIVLCSSCVTSDEGNLIGYLVSGGYDSLTDWGLDSDYRFVSGMGWVVDHGYVVSLVECVMGAMEAATVH